MVSFEDILKKEYKISPYKYLERVRSFGIRSGYRPYSIKFSDKAPYKLMYQKGDKYIYFGHRDYKDYAIHTMLSERNKISVSRADGNRIRYLKRSGGIEGEWEDDKYSKNNLSRNILWDAGKGISKS